jgi:hypothetical protein
MPANNRNDELDLLRWQIEAGERHVSRQLEIIKDMQRRGEMNVMATTLLRVFERTLAGHYEQLRLLERKSA